MIYQVVIKGLRNNATIIDLCNKEDDLRCMTVRQLKSKIAEKQGFDLNKVRLLFKDIELKDDEALSSYGIKHQSIIQFALARQKWKKAYEPSDTRFKFVSMPSVLSQYAPADADKSLRAEMSCGHAVTPESLTGWCLNLLDQGQYQFRCPALKEGTQQMCGALWLYPEVRRMALLTPEEMQCFEEKMARLAAAEYSEFKSCPGCETCIVREDLTNLCVQCVVCTADKNQDFHFCWQCLKEWKGPASRSDRCDNEGCMDPDLELLRNCKTISLPQVQRVDACPSIRACPTCGQIVEHDGSGCNNIICPRCQIEFCFVCLKQCMGTQCSVAPRQTFIPQMTEMEAAKWHVKNRRRMLRTLRFPSLRTRNIRRLNEVWNPSNIIDDEDDDDDDDEAFPF